MHDYAMTSCCYETFCEFANICDHQLVILRHTPLGQTQVVLMFACRQKNER
jgi:hypothetical protein